MANLHPQNMTNTAIANFVPVVVNITLTSMTILFFLQFVKAWMSLMIGSCLPSSTRGTRSSAYDHKGWILILIIIYLYLFGFLLKFCWLFFWFFFQQTPPSPLDNVIFIKILQGRPTLQLQHARGGTLQLEVVSRQCGVLQIYSNGFVFLIILDLVNGCNKNHHHHCLPPMQWSPEVPSLTVFVMPGLEVLDYSSPTHIVLNNVVGLVIRMIMAL